ncbi:MAG: hypothetical protein ACRCXM_08860 [Beijerinckiaceae bacterium]
MSKIEALDRLIDAFERGEGLDANDAFIATGWAYNAARAFHGSIDGAANLCRSLLPGYGWAFNDLGSVEVRPPAGHEGSQPIIIVRPMPPSRALGLAVLKAYRGAL